MKNSFYQPRLFLILSIFFLTLFVSPTFADAATYYVSTAGNNANAGTQASPWRNLSHACNAVNNAGDTIHVVAGTYTSESHCDLKVGVNLEGDGMNNTIIKSSVTGQWSVYMSLQSPQGTPGNQTISNIQFDGQFTGPYTQPGPTSKTWWAIEVRGRANVTMHDIKVVNFVDRGVVFDGNDVQDPMTTPYYSSGNRFYNNTILNSAQHAGQYGAGLLNIGGQKDMLIYGNTLIQDQRPDFLNGWPIKLWDNGWIKDVKVYNNTLIKKNYAGTYPFDHGDFDFAFEMFNIDGGVEIYNNIIQGSVDVNYNRKGTYPYSVWIHDNTFKHTPLGTHQESGIIFEFATESAIVERNTFENYSHGILFNARTRNENGGYAQNPAPVGGYSHLTDNIIRNNLFTNLYSTYSSGGGCCGGLGLNIYLEGDTNDPYVRNMYIYNNTFVTKSNVAPDTGLDFGNATATNADIQGLFIRNNIFQGFTGNWFRGGSGSKFSNVAITNNDAYNNGNSNAISWTGGTPANYTYTNNLTVDPKFISTTNYNLQSVSTLINAGFAPLPIPSQVQAVPFNGSAPDIGYAETGGTSGNQSPTANAGPDQTITLPTNSVTLSGSGTDSDGTIASYAWTKTSTLAGTITNPASATTTVTGLVQGTHTFQLKVTDNLGATGIDTMSVVVNGGTVTATSYTFTGPAVGMVGSPSTNFTITPNGPYTGTITVAVSGAMNTSITKTFSNSSAAQTFAITPTAGGAILLTPTSNPTLTSPGPLSYFANQAPVVNAGLDKTITLPTNSVTLSATATDPNTPMTYLWTKTSGPTGGVITTPTSLTTNITGLTTGTGGTPGIYTYLIEATDSYGAKGGDLVQITVNPAAVQTATSYTFTGPASGVVNTASTVFTLTPNAVYTGTITVTPSGGGLSTPIIKTWSNSSAAQTFTITPTVAGTVTLTPTNSGTLTNASTRTYLVGTGSSLPPTANAGPDQAITLPSNSVTMAGSGTALGGATITGYLWTKLSGGSATITNQASATTTVTGLAEGPYTFELKVTDSNGGTAFDIMSVLVSPVSTGGTYATWNPADKGARVSLSNNNLTAAYGGGKGTVRSTISKSSGKWYWEVRLDNPGNQFIGVADAGANLGNTLGFDAKGWSIVVDDGAKFNNGNNGIWGPSFSVGDIVGVGLDMDNRKVDIYKNGNNVGTMFSNLTGTIYAAWGGELSGAGTANFGASSLSFVPAGYNSGLYGESSAPILNIGTRVKTLARVSVRENHNNASLKLGIQQKDAVGTIIDGPGTGSGYTWWKVDFDNAPDGWVQRQYLGNY